MMKRICKNCEYFESLHGLPRVDCDHPTLEVAVEVEASGTCDKFKSWMPVIIKPYGIVKEGP